MPKGHPISVPRVPWHESRPPRDLMPPAGKSPCERCGRLPNEPCIEDGPGLHVNTRTCPRRRHR